MSVNIELISKSIFALNYLDYSGLFSRSEAWLVTLNKKSREANFEFYDRIIY